MTGEEEEKRKPVKEGKEGCGSRKEEGGRRTLMMLVAKNVYACR